MDRQFVSPRSGRSQPTYEELKLYLTECRKTAQKCSQPTYEELKQEEPMMTALKTLSVPSLPMRN